MATAAPSTTTGQRAASAPFDVDLSIRLDLLQLQLDAQPVGLQRRWIRLKKRWYERHVPTFTPAKEAR